MSKTIHSIGRLIIIFFWLSPALSFAQDEDLSKKLEALSEVVSVNKIQANSFFTEAYEIMVEQPLNHNNPNAGKFNQRVILSNYNKYSPIVLVTEGYNANYATKSSHINELSKILEANQLVVEHRFFGKSVPENPDWDDLSIENAAADLHRIKTIFSKIYNNRNKWVATGISKGGQNTLAYKAYYPTDMDVWIPYVGPVNFDVEDKRMEKFLKNIGGRKCRNKIQDFQIDILKNREQFQPLVDSVIDAKNYTFFITNEEVLDYCVLEYSFSFWQWGHKCSSIPVDTLSIREKFEHLTEVSGLDYYDIESGKSTKPFFIQAVKEFGYYGYDTGPFKDFLAIEDADNYINEVFLADMEAFKFSNKASKFIWKSIQKGGYHVILIYGEYDPWTAAGIIPKRKSKAVAFIKPKGAHKTRIENMSYAQRTDLYILLEKYLGLN